MGPPPPPPSAIQLLHRKLISLVGSFFFSLFSLFRFITAYLFRYRVFFIYENKESINQEAEAVPEANDQKEFDCIEPVLAEPEAEIKKGLFEASNSQKDEEKEENLEVFFTFKFPKYEDFIRNAKEGDSSITTYSNPTTKILQSTANSVKEDEIITADPTISDLIDDKTSIFEGFLSDMDLKKDCDDDDVVEVNLESGKENSDNCKYEEDKLIIKERHSDVDSNIRGGGEFSSEGIAYSEKDSLFTGSDSESTSFEHVRSVMSLLIDSYSDGFLSDHDFRGESEFDSPINIDGKKVELLGNEMSDLEAENWETEESDEEDSDLVEELDHLNTGFLSEKDFHGNPDNLDIGDRDDNEEDGHNNISAKDASDGNNLTSNSGDANELETLWEHQELIEQLKIELRKVRATGLPTILEESESPKIMEDLKPWKIDDTFHHEDCLGELHKVYKSYTERMRRFDILTYQKMYAIGFLQLKDPLQSMKSQRSSGPTPKSLLSQNFWLVKNKSHDNDPMMKFIQELQSDLEVAYVGQMCLSWEFLHWQYGKALDLWESDPHGIRRYNEVADEFQQFQVLIERFLEDEPFQGPRVQHFIKSRCVFRNLLHVPVIREDGFKGKRKARNTGRIEYAISSDMLVEILEESIRIFWRFIRADKDCSRAALKGKKGRPVELQNPEDLELMMEIRKVHQKKKRKLKEFMRCESCVLRKIKKQRDDEEGSDPALYFFSQVNMKLVCRVLNMSKLTTEQLHWCHNKLTSFSFVDRKLHVEPSFLLFPC